MNKVVTRLNKDSCFVAVTIDGLSFYVKLVPSQQRAIRVEQDEIPPHMIYRDEKPSDTTDRQEEQQQPPQEQPQEQPSVGVVGAIAGAAKLAASHLGINATDESKLSQRTAICNKCPKNDLGRCSSCGCYLWAKVRQANERCPIGKW